MNTTGLLAAGVAASLSMATVPHAAAQERSLDEIKKEVMRRAGHINPFEGIRREDAEQVIASLTSLDPDQWAQLWCRIGLAYEANADARASEQADAGELAALYTLAFEYCRVARYPVPSTVDKQEAYRPFFARLPNISIPRCKSSRSRSRARSSSVICKSPPGGRSRRWSCIGVAWTGGRRIASAPAAPFIGQHLPL